VLAAQECVPCFPSRASFPIESNKVEEVEGDPFPRAPAHTPARVTATFATFRAARTAKTGASPRT